MDNFYESQLKRMFEQSELLSADAVFSGKAMISKIGEDLRAKVEFVTAGVHKNYEGLKTSIINRKEGVVDSHTIMFHEVIGMKGSSQDIKPHVWEGGGTPEWFVYKPTYSEMKAIGSKVEDYISMYADQEMTENHGMKMGGV